MVDTKCSAWTDLNVKKLLWLSAMTSAFDELTCQVSFHVHSVRRPLPSSSTVEQDQTLMSCQSIGSKCTLNDVQEHYTTPLHQTLTSKPSAHTRKLQQSVLPQSISWPHDAVHHGMLDSTNSGSMITHSPHLRLPHYQYWLHKAILGPLLMSPYQYCKFISWAGWRRVHHNPCALPIAY